MRTFILAFAAALAIGGAAVTFSPADAYSCTSSRVGNYTYTNCY
jgi:hypothetical protein